MGIFKLGTRRSAAWFLLSAKSYVCVSAPEAIYYIHVILNLYNQLNKFAAFRNVTKLSMHEHGLSAVKVVSFTEKVVLMAVHE